MAWAESWTVTPQVGLSETYSTNLGLTPEPATSGWISDLTPGIRVEGQGLRVRAYLDYGLHILRYSGLSGSDRHLNSLKSGARIEAVEKWLFVDADANITQRNRSPFAATAADASSATVNRSEVTTLRVSPYITGDAAGMAAYRVRFTSIYAKSNDESLAPTHIDQWSASLGNPSGGAKIGWSLDADTSDTKNRVIGNRKDDRLKGRLIFGIPANMRVSLSEGKERTNYISSVTQSMSTPGWGIEWAPNARTQAAYQQENRYFGKGHGFLFNHRASRINLSYSDTRDVAILPALLAVSGQGTISDLMADLLTASIPDPVARAAAVRSRLNREGGILNLANQDDIQTSNFFVRRARDAAIAMITPRNTVTLSISNHEQRVIGEIPNVIDNFSSLGDLHETGGTLSWGHLLTPRASLDIALNRLRRTGVDDSTLRAYQTTQTAALSYRIAPKIFTSVGLRSIKFDSTINGSFREKAIAFSLTQRF